MFDMDIINAAMVRQRDPEAAAAARAANEANAKKQELGRSREAAERASAAKSDFVAVMSHELRTPLNAILGHLDLCLRTELDGEQRKHTTRAQKAARALLEIVNDVLDFSKIEADKLELEQRTFDLESVLQQLRDTCALSATRTDGATYMLQRAGDYTLPPIDVAWWSTGSNTIERLHADAIILHVADNPALRASGSPGSSGPALNWHRPVLWLLDHWRISLGALLVFFVLGPWRPAMGYEEPEVVAPPAPRF